MAEIIIDASLAAAWCFPDERSDYTNSVLEAVSTPREALAPRLWAYEIRNSVLVGLRRRRITRVHAEMFLKLITSLPIRLTDPASYDAVVGVAERHDLTVYDAAYLDLAMREGLPLASIDEQLNRAAENSGVPLFRAAGHHPARF